jgi:hypothetical protein
MRVWRVRRRAHSVATTSVGSNSTQSAVGVATAPRACYNIGMKEKTEDRDINIAIAGIFAGGFIAVGILHMLVALIGSLGVGTVLGVAVVVGWAAVAK